MFAIDDFVKSCTQILEVNFGHISNAIINDIRKKENLNENSTDTDIKKFIDLIEAKVRIFSGKKKATEVCNIIRETAKEHISTTDIGKITEISAVELENAKKVEDIGTEEVIELAKTDDPNSGKDKFEYNEILVLLELGYEIDNILKELNTEEEILADKIIDLGSNEFIILEDKKWILTQKGKDILKEKREEFKNLKLDYLHGNVNKEEFLKKSKELEYLKRSQSSLPFGGLDS